MQHLERIQYQINHRKGVQTQAPVICKAQRSSPYLGNYEAKSTSTASETAATSSISKTEYCAVALTGIPPVSAIRMPTNPRRNINLIMQLKAADFECLAGLTGLEEVEILDYASNRKCCMPKWVNVISRIGFEWSPYVKVSAQELRPVRARGGRMVPLFFSRRGRPMV
ncbi:hypothetical protein HBH86_056820 [Parastagonospora nodorum]|nr:hypothetical protein HBH50_010220 [Parastagonospora nodorum]KAH4562409.1 hypothetical protein HBH86_056820 [Parastagonospora nodorum]KAH4583158.1 hypothetical protein HBH84_026770 [Parastagonospora nodorum]KAH4807780.1 hypothetical protein HBH61_128270 [Parastagonospora nodorum]KAH5192617.1 hypothetical protein HBH68_146350 [Parastagonospora nodorum]